MGISTDELLSVLQADTRKYLLENGKNVNPLDESEIRDFYSSVVKICDDISYSLLDHEDIALARLLNRETEKKQNSIVSEIDRKSEIIRSELSSQGDMIGQSLQKMNELISNRNGTFTMATPKQTMLEVAPYKYIGGSEKRQYVKNLTSDLKKCQWIHIYGKMFTGKTQTLIRIAEHLAFCIWITIEDALDMKVSYDTNCQLVANALFTIKALRNAIAHNNIAFDARFKDRDANKNIIKWVEDETGITNVKFEYFSDYIALIVCLLKHVQYPKKMLIKFLKEYEECINDLYSELPLPIYNKIVATGIKGKLTKLNVYIRK